MDTALQLIPILVAGLAFLVAIFLGFWLRSKPSGMKKSRQSPQPYARGAGPF
jgi:uncharacterized protein YneF (UPF0154 family)